jgi:hypothetical protein
VPVVFTLPGKGVLGRVGTLRIGGLCIGQIVVVFSFHSSLLFVRS